MVNKKTNKLNNNFRRIVDFKPIIIGCTLVTLFFSPNLQDPFNAPKFILLSLFGAWILGILFVKFSFKGLSYSHKILMIILGFFLVSNYISMLNSSNKYISIFGETQRKSGVISYSLLALVLLYTSLSFNIQNKKLLYKSILFTAYLSSAYGLMQHYGLDFVKWNNPYNAIISTLGNPNFAAAVFAILGILVYGILFDSEISSRFKLVVTSCLILILVTIIFSNARQGLLVFILGVTLITLVRVYVMNKKFGLFIGLIFIFLAMLSILGMLNSGPLSSWLYKPSVSIRGFYWRAGIEMFRDNFWFGVGPDMYGYFFKEYRELEYVLNYGYNITSTNAHNLPIQMFATGGIFVGVSYLCLLLFVFWSGLKSIRFNKGNKRILSALVLSAWVGYQAQSIVSIDNLGIAVWGWMLSGLVVNLSCAQPENSGSNYLKVSTISRDSKQLIISSTFTVISLLLCFNLYKSEIAMKDVYRWYNPQYSQNNEQFYKIATETFKSPLLDPNYKVVIGSFLPPMGHVDEGIKILKKECENNPRNLDCMNIISSYLEQIKDYEQAITYRLKIRNLDPWNAANLLQLGRDYKFSSNFKSMSEIRNEIYSFASNTNEGKIAVKELQ
jgi:O-antigen ligase